MLTRLLNSKFKKDLSFSYITQAITVSFGFLQLFLINRYFGVATFGQLAIIMSTAGIFSSLLTAKSSEAVTRFFKREELKQNYENAKFVLLIGFSIDFITAMLLVALIYFASTFIATIFLKDIELQDEIVLYSFITFFGFLRGTLFGYLQSKEMFVNMNIVTMIESFMKIAMIISFIFIWNLTNLDDIIYSFLVASMASFSYTIYIFLTSYLKEFKNIKLQINKKLLKEYWSFNIKTFLSSSLKIGATNIDNLILGYYSNNETVGIYQTIKKFLSPLSFITAPFSSLMLPKLIGYYEKGEVEYFHKLIFNITIKIIVVSSAILFVFYSSLHILFNIQNIEYNNIIFISFLIASFQSLLSVLVWFGRIFYIMYNPTLPIYSNLLLSINSIWIPILLYKIDYFDDLIAICLGMLLSYFPSWLFTITVYLKFIRKNKINLIYYRSK